MATDLIMPRPDQQQIHHHAFFNQSAAPSQSTPRTTFQSQNYPQISPLSTSNSTNTASNASPQSPKAHYGRQVRPFSYLSLAGLGAFGRLRRRSTDESRKSSIPEDNSTGWDLGVFPVVTDMPTRRHWKPDSDSTICDEPTCKRHFGYFTRRHHCRRCGNIFCDDHSSNEIPLDQNAEYNPRAPALSRSCNHCYSEYSAWRSRTNSQASSTASSEANLHMLAHGHQRSQSHHILSSTGGSPVIASPAAINTPNPLTPVASPEAAASVPRDWNWSTF